ANALGMEVAGLLPEAGRVDADLHVLQRSQIGREARVERAATEPGHGSRELAAELLALHDPPPERQARVDAGIAVHVRRRQALSEAPADRAQLVEQHRLGDALELDAHRLADLDEIADAIEG